MQDAFQELSWRGLIHTSTEGAAKALAEEKLTIYNGFDPTADSLHVGHLVPIIALSRLQKFGHTPIGLAGGGTGMIGDPSFKATERPLLTVDEIDANVAAIKHQLSSILDFEVATNPAQVVNNADWLRDVKLLDFLREIGKHFTVNYMMAKDSVKDRLGRDSGLSFTEFSYQILQGYDFMHLYDTLGCKMQTGGSDQWGNIVAGTSLLRKKRRVAAHAMAYPLITRADGTKFGKTAEGEAVWLAPERTSPYRFYQFFINFEDEKVIEGLRFYTFLDQETIADFAHKVATEPHRREAQRRLAEDVTRLVHGETALSKAQQASKVLFGGSLDGLMAADIEDIFAEVPSTEIDASRLAGDGASLVDLLVESGVASSKGDARRSIKGGAINLNNVRIQAVDSSVSAENTVEGKFMVLRKGKRHYHLIKVLS